MPNNEAHPQTSALTAIAANTQLSGQPAYAPTQEELAAIATLPEGSALLIGTNGELRGARFLLNIETDETGAVKPIVAGRSPISDVYLNSLNGTYVNGDRIDNAYLQNGSHINIGKFHFAFFLGTGK